MSTAILLEESRSASFAVRVAAYVELAKLRIASVVGLSVAAAAAIASWRNAEWSLLCHAAGGAMLAAVSASAANQWWERDRDALMERTKRRPLPQGRLSPSEAAGFALVTLAIALVWLVQAVNVASALITLGVWVGYVLVYTPLKPLTSFNTLVGAIPGAMPMLIGWAAVEAPWDLRACALFAIVFLWQFPHFMAIAWLYRDQYDAAGYRMLTTVDRSGRSAAIQALAAGAVLIPVSVLPAISVPGWGSIAYAAVAFSLGVWQWSSAWRFAVHRDRDSARSLLARSLIYLPLLLVSLVALPGR